MNLKQRNPKANDIVKVNILPEQNDVGNFIDKAFTIFKDSDGTIKPHFVLTGETGSGKSYLISTLAQKHKFNIINVNAAQITQEGVSGNSLSKVLTPLAISNNNPTVVFVDEFDKWFTASDDAFEGSSTLAVQNEFLKLLEGNTTEVFGTYGKYVTVSLEKVLFVFAGAFNGKPVTTVKELQNLGVRAEFLGRVSLVKYLDRLSLDSLKQYLKSSDLLDKYIKFSKVEENKVQIVKKLTKELEDEFDQNIVGVRLVNNLIHKYFLG